MRISTKYGLWLGIAAVATAIALGVQIYRQVSNILQERATEAQLAGARGILDRIERTLFYARRDMRILAEDEFLQAYVNSPADRREIDHRLLEAEIQERSEITGPWDVVSIFDRYGRQLLTTSPHEGHGVIDSNPAMRTAMQAAMSGEIFSSDWIDSGPGGNPTLIFSASIRSVNETGKEVQPENGSEVEEVGDVIGVVVALFHWPAIAAILAQSHSAGAVHLFNSTGRVLAEYVPEVGYLDQAHLAQHRSIQQALTATGLHEAVHPTKRSGHMVLSAHVVQTEREGVPNYGWGILVEQPESLVFAPARQLAWESVAIVVGVLAILTLTLTLMGYRLLHPLTWFTGIAEQIGQGDFRHHIEYRAADEVGALARSFNTMIDRLAINRSELLAAKNRIQGIVDTVPGIIYSASPHDHRIVFVSPAVEPLLGYRVEEMIADPGLWRNQMVVADRKQALAGIGAALEQGIDFTVTYRLRHRNGESIRWFEDRGSWERDQSGRIVAIHGVMTDITERRQREDQLARTTRALDILHNQDTILTRATTESELLQGSCANIVDSQVYQFAWVGLLDLDHPSHLCVAAHAGNDAEFAARLGSGTIDATSDSCLPCRAVREKKPCMVENLAGVGCTDECELQMLTQSYASLISLPLLNDSHVLGCLNIYGRNAITFDAAELHLLGEIAGNLGYGITALRTQALHDEARERLAHQAFHDTLTGLPNRAMFIQSLQMALAQAERGGSVLAVLFIDLDDFKLVNDTLGHSAGDELLRQVGRRIKASIRVGDMVARQGGDEFIVLMPGVNSQSGPVDQAQDEESMLLNPGLQAQRLVEQLKQPFIIEGQKTYIGASIGITLYPHDAQDADTLLGNADSAMYRAKELGRGSYVFYSAELTERQHRRMSLANCLHQALEQDQFLLYYQPVIELSTGKLAGVEALIRWQSPSGELVPPGEFLPVAEDTGLIIPIGDWVLREACRQINAWEAEGFYLSVAINLSARQLWQGEIADKILGILAEAGVGSECIELEITESAMSHDPQNMEEAFMRFDAGGLRISLDDFGTGYSSLSRLKRLPIHTLKIDRSFIDGVPDDEDDTAIVTATLQMAHSLGLASLAEGIETRAQWEWLRERGCMFGQGFHFSRPVPAEEIGAMLRYDQRWTLTQNE